MKTKLYINLKVFISLLLIIILNNSCEKTHENESSLLCENTTSLDEVKSKSNCIIELYDTANNSNEVIGEGNYTPLAKKEFRLNNHKYYRDCEGNIVIIAKAYAYTKGQYGHNSIDDDNCSAKAMVYLVKNGQLFNCFIQEDNNDINLETGAGFTWAEAEVTEYWGIQEEELSGVSIYAQGYVYGCYPPKNGSKPQLINWGERHGVEINLENIINIPAPNVTLGLQNNSLKISWGSIIDATGYEVWRKIDNETEIRIKTTSSCEFVDTGASQYLNSGKKISYRVKSVISSYKSYFSNPVLYSNLSQPSITITEINSMPKISWQPIINASTYEVWRKIDNSSFELIANISSPFYIDSDVITKPNKQNYFYYKVKAKNNVSTSTFSNTLWIKGQIPL